MTDKFRHRLDLFLITGVLCFFASFTLASYQWYRINQSWIESRFFPVVKYLSFDDWQRNEIGQWSATVTIDKLRPECVYVSGQIQTVLGALPGDQIKESTISFLGDKTPGNNRNAGVQRLDRRVQIDDPEFVPGTSFTGSVLHRCHPGQVTVTTFGPFVVGESGHDN